jgi:type I restriction enzyme, R subunit
MRSGSTSETMTPNLAPASRAFAPPLSDDELAFYDAVAENQSAVTEMGAGVLADIARDLVRSLRRDVTTDWVSRDDVRTKLRSTIKRLLAKYGYPPDAQPTAIDLVIRQMETFADEWSPRPSATASAIPQPTSPQAQGNR